MENLYTARQVQELLKINRITVYRMLQDGRLKGVKIGQQWRFPASQFEHLESLISRHFVGMDNNSTTTFPVPCIQAIQNLYVELALVGAIILDDKGHPITEVSRPCDFCRLILASTSGKKACEQSWIDMAMKDGQEWNTCHAGLYYRRAPIVNDDGKIAAYFISGQFYLSTQDEEEKNRFVQQLAHKYQINEAILLNTIQTIKVCDINQSPEVITWPLRFTQVIEMILRERNSLVERLNRIVEIGTL